MSGRREAINGSNPRSGHLFVRRRFALACRLMGARIGVEVIGDCSKKVETVAGGWKWRRIEIALGAVVSTPAAYEEPPLLRGQP